LNVQNRISAVNQIERIAWKLLLGNIANFKSNLS